MKGKIAFFDEQKGRGFITHVGEDNKVTDYFVSYKVIDYKDFKTKTLPEDQIVTFEPIKVPGIGLKAIKVTPIEENSSTTTLGF